MPCKSMQERPGVANLAKAGSPLKIKEAYETVRRTTTRPERVPAEREVKRVARVVVWEVEDKGVEMEEEEEEEDDDDEDDEEEEVGVPLFRDALDAIIKNYLESFSFRWSQKNKFNEDSGIL